MPFKVTCRKCGMARGMTVTTSPVAGEQCEDCTMWTLNAYEWIPKEP